MGLTSYKCRKCRTEWRYKPKRTVREKLNNGQCDCGEYIGLDNADLI